MFCFLSFGAGAQEEKVQKIRFQSSLRAGVLEGDAGSAFQMNMVNGFRFKTFSAGIGAGLDYYAIRSIPVFLELRKDIFSSGKTPFLYASGGRHFEWAEPMEENQWTKSTFEDGWFYDLGIGYSIPIKSHSIFFTAGYSYKDYKEKVENYVMCIWGDCPVFNETFSYKLRRISIRTGFRF